MSKYYYLKLFRNFISKFDNSTIKYKNYFFWDDFGFFALHKKKINCEHQQFHLMQQQKLQRQTLHGFLGVIKTGITLMKIL